MTLVERPLSGGPMTLNYRTEPDGWVCVELVEPPHTPPQLVDVLPGCGLDAADPLVGDELGRMVTWRGSGDLSALAGREVSVRLHLKRAQVFCLSL